MKSEDYNFAFFGLYTLRQGIERDLIVHKLADGSELDERMRQSNIQALTVALKVLSKHISKDFESEMRSLRGLADVF